MDSGNARSVYEDHLEYLFKMLMEKATTEFPFFDLPWGKRSKIECALTHPEFEEVDSKIKELWKKAAEVFERALNWSKRTGGMSEEEADLGWKVRATYAEPIYIDAYPDESYPLRILEAHLAMQEGTFVSDNTAGDPPENPLLIEMNKASKERAELLRKAIAKLSAE